MARLRLFLSGTVLVLISSRTRVEGSLPNSCTETTNQQCRPNECNSMHCYCSPLQQMFGHCIPMMTSDTCFKSTHSSCGNCVSGSSGSGLCKHDKFNIPFNYAPDNGCEMWAANGGCTEAELHTFMNTCCIKSCYKPSNRASIEYNEDRCVGLRPQHGSLARNLFIGEFESSTCITKCIEKRYEYIVLGEGVEIVGASFEKSGGKCWCAYAGATEPVDETVNSPYYCKFQLPNIC